MRELISFHNVHMSFQTDRLTIMLQSYTASIHSLTSPDLSNDIQCCKMQLDEQVCYKKRKKHSIY